MYCYLGVSPYGLWDLLPEESKFVLTCDVYFYNMLLFTVPAFILTALVFSFKKKSWQCPDTTLALAAWVCALFFFGAGLFAIKVTA